MLYCQVSNQNHGQWEGEGKVQRIDGRGISGGIITCAVIGMEKFGEVVTPM